MKKIKLIVSDFHLGSGRRLSNGSINSLEDFLYDSKFKEFLEFHCKGAYEGAEVELILNGDMLNLIMTDYHGHFTVILTENVSKKKLKSIIAGHPLFFKTLRDFLKNPNHHLTYILGNHDQEMLWRGTREMFEKAVGAKVNWRNTHYQIDGMHIEHGHQYEAANRMDPTRLFLTENLPEPILNLPWGTLFAVQFLLKLKKKRHFVDKVRPYRMLIWWSLFHDTWFAISSLIRLCNYFISTRFSKNRYRQSSLKTTFKILSEVAVVPELTEAAKRILRTPEIHTVIFGHAHVYCHDQYGEGKQYINTGSWTEIISLDLQTWGRRTRLTFVRVEYDDKGAALPHLRHWIGKVSVEDDALAPV